MTTHNVYDGPCGRSCPMVDPQVSKQFFEDFGGMKRDVQTIKDAVIGSKGLGERVGELEAERHTNAGRKQQQSNTRALLISMLTIAGFALDKLYGYFHGRP